MQPISSFLIIPLPGRAEVSFLHNFARVLTLTFLMYLHSYFSLTTILIYSILFLFFFNFCLMFCTVRMFKCFRSSEDNN